MGWSKGRGRIQQGEGLDTAIKLNTAEYSPNASMDGFGPKTVSSGTGTIKDDNGDGAALRPKKAAPRE